MSIIDGAEPPAHPARDVRVRDTVIVSAPELDPVAVDGISLQQVNDVLVDVLAEAKLTNELLKGILQ